MYKGANLSLTLEIALINGSLDASLFHLYYDCNEAKSSS